MQLEVNQYPMNKSGKICFENAGYIFCNFIVRNGKIVKSKTGKWLRFPISKLTTQKELSSEIDESSNKLVD